MAGDARANASRTEKVLPGLWRLRLLAGTRQALHGVDEPESWKHVVAIRRSG